MSTLDSAARRQILATTEAFAGVGPEQQRVIAEMMRVEEFAKGEVVFERGEPADCILVVAAGQLAVYVPDSDGPVEILGPGSLLGEYGLFAGFVRIATVRAVTDTRVLTLDYERFRAFLFQVPEAMFTLFPVAVGRLTAANAR
ncbi:MAG: cyclic nucleotide-binding domain-containing protein [Deltaproteobacteria bacterium]|nr:cyclic nucleotide-binding domain-containing protein [Deltaproteobacteria bacterium]